MNPWPFIEGAMVGNTSLKHDGFRDSSSRTFSLFAVAVLGIMSGCGTGPAPPVNANGLITDYGTYRLHSIGAELTVIDEPRGIVAYDVAVPDGMVLIDSASLEARASGYSRWSFYWDDENKDLWFHSSDTGSGVWRERSPGAFEYAGLRPDSVELVQQMPDEFYQSLPHSLKGQWAEHR